MTLKVRVTFVVGFTELITPNGNRGIRDRLHVLHDNKGNSDRCGRFDPVYDHKGHRVNRGRHNLVCNSKGSGKHCRQFDLVYNNKRSEGQ